MPPENNTVPASAPTITEETVVHSTLQGKPSPKAQSWGAVISIIVIVLMVVVGAFYAWGKRISQNSVYPTGSADSGTNDSGL